MIQKAKELVDKFVWPEGVREAAIGFAFDMLEKDPDSLDTYLPELVKRRHRLAVNIRSQSVHTRPWGKEQSDVGT